MHLRATGSLLLGLSLALAMATTALAQSSDDQLQSVESGQSSVVDQAAETPDILFLTLLEPAEADVLVPLATSVLMVRGVSLPDAVVSLDGDLAEIDPQGGFVGSAPLEEGANAITIIASDTDGHELTTTLYVVRGD